MIRTSPKETPPTTHNSKNIPTKKSISSKHDHNPKMKTMNYVASSKLMHQSQKQFNREEQVQN
jgi:hypothetical protein